MRKRAAAVISRLLDPTVEIPIAILFAVAVVVKEGLRWRFLGLLVFVDLVVPFIFFLTMLYHKQISDWDIRRREQRLPLYFFTMMCHLGGMWMAHELGKTDLAQILFIFWLAGVAFAAVTVFWKISLHAGVNAFLVTLVNMYYHWQYWWLYGLVLLVMWARVYQKHHSSLQVWAGTALGIALVVGGLAALGV